MKKWIGALLNFFFPGLGNLVFGYKRELGLFWLPGVLGLTYVEQSIKEPLPQMYWIMFGAVLWMNIGFAIDAYRGIKAMTEGAGAPAAAVK